MHPLERQTAHRPWPLPRLPWIMRQTWCNLLFLHYALPPEWLRARVPEVLPLDTFDGHAWLSITPFYLSGLTARGVPPLPVISQFPELNVRTYVTLNGKPGIFFFSLDAGNFSAVWGARVFYRLPYWHADMRMSDEGEWFRYSSRRMHGPQPAEFRGRYRPTSPPAEAANGSLEYFLAERYCLYAVDHERVYRADIHHLPWPLQRAEAEIELNTMAAPLGMRLREPALVQFGTRRLDVLVWPPERLRWCGRAILEPARCDVHHIPERHCSLP